MRELTTENKKILETINSVLQAYNFDPLQFFSYGKNGAEYFGSCVRCHQLGGTYEAGTKHFKVWPDREMVGERVFYCRECYKPLDPSTHWTGDLLQYLQDTMNVSPYKAKELIGMDAVAFEKVASKPLVPTMSLHGAPNDTWQQRALSLIEECVESLWGDEGKAALHYLMHTRKLTEKTIREARLGYQPDPDLWEDAETWGLDGKRLHIHQGIVIPGLHYAPQSHAIEVWSITIRRPETSIITEAVERNVDIKKVSRYMYVRGSENNVLYSESVVNKFGFIVEGPFNGLSIIQEGRGEFGAGVTQGTGGGHGDIFALRMLSQTKGVLVSLDPDDAGRKASEYWMELLENSINHEAINGDVNDMHQQGHDLYQWMCEGRDLLLRSRAFLASLEDVPVPLEVVPIPSISNGHTEPSTVFSEAIIKCGFIDKVTGEVCDKDKSENHSHAVHHYCERCMQVAPSWRVDRNGFHWCDQHFMCWQLMETGALTEYCNLFVPAGKGYMGIEIDNNNLFVKHIHEEVTYCGVRAGLQHYFNFCNSAHCGQISLAYEEASRMIRVLALKNYVEPVKVEVVEEIKKSLNIFELAQTVKKMVPIKITCIHESVVISKDAKGRPILKILPCKNPRVYGLFCDGHKSNADLLAAGENFGYPSIQINKFITLEAGYEPWLRHVTRRTEAQLTGYGYTRENPSLNPDIVPDLPAVVAMLKQYS